VPPVLAHPSLWRTILDATIFGVTGIALLILGYYIWELVTPYNLRRELQENKNLAVAVVAASFVLGMAIVIASALVHIG
jgi:putative membrane protein